MNKLYGFGALAVALTASGALAQWVETGDAGELVGTAQTPLGVGALTTITGSVGGDTDMYLISINSPATFSASTVGSTGGRDSQLWLFTTSGMGIACNDDSVGFESTLSGPLVTSIAPGNYLLAVNGFNSNALSAGGLIFPDTFPGVFGPTGPGGGSPLTGWTGAGASFGYTITLTGARFVPGPASLALLGLVGLAGRRRRA